MTSAEEAKLLLPYAATTYQRANLEAIIEHGSCRAAARATGKAKSPFQETILRVRKVAAIRGFAPDQDLNYPLPSGQIIRGVSTLIDKATNTSRLQWVKTSVDDAKREEIMKAVFAGLAEELPRVPPTEGPVNQSSPNLMCLYVITDYHFAQLSDGYETRNEDYDLKIAENLLISWFKQAIEKSPDADVGVFAQCGDFMHFSGSALEAVTETGKNVLDADSRLYKLVRVVVRVVRSVIQMLLEKHRKVHVIFAEGNHDISASVYMREWLHVIYENEERITIDLSADPYYAYEFGETSIFVHHGHKRKVSDISKVFAAKFREIFGRTKHSYAHLGHLHHVDVKEDHLMIVEQHRTLAPPDAYSSRGGHVAGRDAKVIVYHRKYGEVGRITINSAMVKDRCIV